MAVPLDLITHKNLMLIKQIYQRAVVQSSHLHSEVDLILSLISFDLANETLLKNAITAVDSSRELISDLKKLIKLANDVFANTIPVIPPVPDAQKVGRVRNLRNGAMHQAKYPTATDINDCRTYTRDFLQQIVTNVWGVAFDAISLTAVIKNERVRDFLIKAEKELANGDYEKAIGNAIAGFDQTMNSVRNEIVGEVPTDVNAFIMLGYEEQKPSREILESFKNIQNIVFQSLIGLDHISYIKYKRATRPINVHIFSDHIEVNFEEDNIDPNDVDFVVNFVINSVIQIESLVGDIDDPFGHNKWWEEGKD